MLSNINSSIQRILAVRLDNIGDVIMLGPALRALRLAFPEARITLMASPSGSQAGVLLPWIDDMIVWRAVWQDISGKNQVGIASELSLIDQIRLCQFDLSLIFTSFSQSPYPPGYVCMLAGVPIRAGQSKEFGGAILTHSFPSVEDEVHQVDRNLSLLFRLGIPLAGNDLDIRIPEDAQSRVDQLLMQTGLAKGQPFVVVAPGASCSARRYPLERFTRVIQLLQQKSGLPIVIAGSENELDRFRSLLKGLVPIRGIYSLVGRTTIPEFAGLIQRSSLVIANNSAALHIADALKIPNVILYSGTEFIAQWEPRGSTTAVLNRPTTCSPCYRFNCPYHLECLEISPEEVVDAAIRILDSIQEPVGIQIPNPSRG